ncbi:putative serine/threonine-protein kinase [Carex littledalei]|uniref:Putative serine/threonine-protein kinase n=1 Tax=Carex littledalei TaxID=544730 RepID=A0A833QTN0_9POAL|nr:putative serine/threonine-protein kinase [Carex littledalei]
MAFPFAAISPSPHRILLLFGARIVPESVAYSFGTVFLYLLSGKHIPPSHASAIKHNLESLPMYAFPVAAILMGALSGLFGIGGGLLLNPIFLHIGLPPQVH